MTALAVLAGCGALDSILSSAGTYKINANINDISLDDFSIVTSKDKIEPFFEEPVSEDPDITELVIYLKDSRGMTTGYKVTYRLTDKDNNKEDDSELQSGQDNSKTENETEAQAEKQDEKEGRRKRTEKLTEKQDEKKNDKNEVDLAGAGEDKDDNEEPEEENKAPAESDPPGNIEYIINGNEIIFMVESLDEPLPFLPLPSDLPIGKYTLVFQVIGKNTILFKSEKSFYYLADAKFSFETIQVNLPGIAENSQFIQNGNVILLDIKLDFDSRLEPYIIWYNGKRIIDEGSYSDGAGTLLWKAPEQNGFVSLSAEVFPSLDRMGLSGQQKGISLLVSSREIDMHLLSPDTPDIVYWYTFEGNLNDSFMKGLAGRAIEPAGKNKIKWLSSNGTYGLASGADTYTLPGIPFTNNGNENWQIISRFKPLDEGEILSVQFGPIFDVTMTLSNNKSNLILTLASASKTYSEVLNLPDEEDSFVTASVKFFIQSGLLSAKLNLEGPAFSGNFDNQNNPVINPLSLEADLDKEYRIILGQPQKIIADNTQTSADQRPAFTALWDELAILRLPAVEIMTIETDTEETITEEAAVIEDEPPEVTAENASVNVVDGAGFNDDIDSDLSDSDLSE
ncbi:MAG: hypothetical protein LBI04_05410 [Treponema sp.]|nr:hypothetical protein [Treponema sp.]